MNTILREVCGNICEMSTFAETQSIHTDTTVYYRTQLHNDRGIRGEISDNTMIDVSKFVGQLNAAGVVFLTGVPDSLLKSFCAYVTDTCGENHVIAANEGGAVG